MILATITVWTLPALAAETSIQAGERPDILITGNIAFVSDYIWRGQSQTWGNPALQAGIEANHTSGIYAGIWASNVSDQWVPGAHMETDWYAGYRNKLAGALSDVGYDLNVIYAYFPGGNFDKTGFNLPASSPNTVEVYAAVNYKWVTFKTGRVLTKFYGWDTNNSSPGAFTGDPNAGVTGNTNGSYYVEANFSYDIAEGWNINGQSGHQTIRNSTGLNWSYYKAGITRTMGNWAASLIYSESSEPNAYKGFVSLKNNGNTYSAAKPQTLISISRSF